MIITLSGFMGSGKSSVGRELRTLLFCDYIDLDSLIEQEENKSIPEIFSEYGETKFREIEFNKLNKLLLRRKSSLILSLGGGTITHPQSAELIKKHTFRIYLKTSCEVLTKRLQKDIKSRPLINTGDKPEERIQNLLLQRIPIYESQADLIIETDHFTPKEIANIIAKQLHEQGLC